jgi:hypothetical protein
MLQDQKPWHRVHDDPSIAAVPQPKSRFYPTSRQDLIDIVELAESMPIRTEVRASGSHWALSDASVTNDFLVETQDPEGGSAPPFNQTLQEVIPGCMTTEAIRFFIEQGVEPFDPTVPPDHSKFYLFHVEAGTRIYELYCRLDAGDDHPKSLASLLATQFQTPGYAGPWALPTIGGAGGQTIVGAFSTGTHGGDVHLPPIADAIQAIHLIGPQGRQFWIEKPLRPGVNIVDDSKLQNLYGAITVLRDPDVFNSVIVAAGRMGIIYSVVLRVVRQFALKEDRYLDTWSNVKQWVNNPAHPIFTNNRFVQVVVNPNSQVDNPSEHTCFVTCRNVQPLIRAGIPPAFTPYGREQRCGVDKAGNSHPIGSDPGSFLNIICTSGFPAKAALTEFIQQMEDIRNHTLLTTHGHAVALANSSLPPLFREALELAFTAGIDVAAAAQALIFDLNALRNPIPDGSPICFAIGAISNWAAANNHFEVLRYVSDKVLSQQLSAQSVTAISYAIMDFFDYLDVGCFLVGDSMEVFFDASSPNLVAFVEQLFGRMSELENGSLTGGQPGAFAGFVSLRFMSQTAALIGMQKFPRTCAIEIGGCSNIHGAETFLARIEMDAVAMSGTVHWGQRNDVTMEMVEDMFNATGPTGALFRWRKALSALSKNGRFHTFSTNFTRLRGLEVVQPLVGSFTVHPTSGYAGSLVHVTWRAGDNPPGTVATLEIQPSGSPPTTIQLGGLDGSQDVPLPAGNSDLTLQVALTVNGRTLTDSSTIQVQGFSARDTRTIEDTAT